jgi:hypothetical protein
MRWSLCGQRPTQIEARRKKTLHCNDYPIYSLPTYAGSEASWQLPPARSNFNFTLQQWQRLGASVLATHSFAQDDSALQDNFE